MYIAVDIETTGLDPDDNQILEVGAVLHVPGVSIMECPAFRQAIFHETIIGHHYALTMNADLIANMDRDGVALSVAMKNFFQWLDREAATGRHNMVGANVGSFDRQFLKNAPGWVDQAFAHRHLEVGSMFATEEGIPSQHDLWMKHKDKIETIVGNEHEALFDARVSLALARLKWSTDAHAN
jgi:oligoribonuclease (3'-5' exoribonuclease)